MSIASRFRALIAPASDPMRGMDWFTFNGITYPLTGLNTSYPGAKQEDIDGSFESFTRQMYRANGVIFACMYARQRLFVQARFKYRRLTAGRPGDLWGDRTLGILDQPWTGGTTGDLLGRTLQHADLAGNAYIARRPGNRLKVMRPDWTSIILDAPASDLDAQVVGYQYQPGGHGSGNDPVVLLPEQVAHFAPIADPLAAYRGISWLTPLIRELMADSAATAHKLAFFEQGATPNLVIKRNDEIDKDAYKKWVELMEAGHSGVANAYKTLYLSAGADATVIGTNLRQMDFKLTQGAGETRIAAAAGVPPIIVGLSEGLQSATYSNYGQARRAFADLWARPTWQNAAGSFATIAPPPAGSELWYDDRDIPFLAEDQKDQADIEHVKAQTIRTLVDGGYTPDSVVKAVDAADMTLLKHSGLYSVQLQPPGTTAAPTIPAATVPPPTNGKVPSGVKP